VESAWPGVCRPFPLTRPQITDRGTARAPVRVPQRAQPRNLAVGRSARSVQLRRVLRWLGGLPRNGLASFLPCSRQDLAVTHRLASSGACPSLVWMKNAPGPSRHVPRFHRRPRGGCLGPSAPGRHNRQEVRIQTRDPDAGNPTPKRQGRRPGAPGASRRRGLKHRRRSTREGTSGGVIGAWSC